MEESVAEGRNRQRSGSGPPLSRSLGVVHTSFIGVGTAIGATIFVITGNAIASAGPAIILSYLFGALSAITDGTSYSELASSMPNAGGGYHFVRRALGGVPSFLTGWFSWIGNAVDCSVGAIAFSFSVGYYVKWIEPFSLAIITLLIFAFINYRGTKSLGISEIVLTSILIMGIIIYVGGASQNADITRFTPFFPNGYLPAVMMVSYIFPTFAGYETVATMSEEVKIAGKNVPKAIFMTLLISTVMFLGVTVATLVAAPLEVYANSPTPILDVANYFMGPIGAFLIVICSITASLTGLNGAMAAATRVSYAMSRDGLLPTFFEKVHSKYNIPYRTLLLSVTISTLFILTRSVELIVYMISLGYIVTSIFVGLSVIRLRSKEPHLYRPFKVPLYPFTTFLAIGTTLFMIPSLSIESLVLGSIFAVIGLVMLTAMKRMKK